MQVVVKINLPVCPELHYEAWKKTELPHKDASAPKILNMHVNSIHPWVAYGLHIRPLIHTHYSLGRGLPQLACITLKYSSMKFSTITCSDFHNLTSWNLPVWEEGPGCSYIETRMLPSSSEHRSTLGGEINESWMSTNLCILWSRTTLWHPSGGIPVASTSANAMLWLSGDHQNPVLLSISS